MARPQNVIPTQKIHVALPITLLTKLTTLLWSDAEGCLPSGSYMRFFTERLEEFFSWEALDLSTYVDLPPKTFVVHGDAASIEQLKEKLK